MGTLSIILKLAQPNIFMANLDIKDAYYTIQIKDEGVKTTTV